MFAIEHKYSSIRQIGFGGYYIFII